MHDLETIVKRNEIAQKVYDDKEKQRFEKGELSLIEWAKLLNVPTKEVSRILGY